MSSPVMAKQIFQSLYLIGTPNKVDPISLNVKTNLYFTTKCAEFNKSLSLSNVVALLYLI